MGTQATGIPGFDEMLGGGLPDGSGVILQGPSGSEKLLFALTFLAEGLRAGGCAVLVVASQSAESLLSQLRGLGVDLDVVAKDNRLRIVDWYSWSEEPVTDVEERGIILRSSIDLANLGAAVSRAIASLPNGLPNRAVVEMLSPALNVYELSQVYAFAQSTKRKLDRFSFTSFFVVEKDMHTASILSTLAQPFDGVVEIERVRSGDTIVRKIGVLHLKDAHPETTFLPLEMTSKGFQVVHPTAASGVPPAVPIAKTVSVPLSGPFEAKGDRAKRIELIGQIAKERLASNPVDADAWFALAATQATAGDVQGSLASLGHLAEINEAYPGLWILKAKLHARLGQEEEWRQARMEADRHEAASIEPSPDFVPCPVCGKPVAAEASLCPNCGSQTAPELDVIEELAALVREGPPEPEPLTEAELKALEGLEALASEAAEPEKPKQEAVAAKPAARAAVRTPKAPSSKGLTNGLIIEESARRARSVGGAQGRTNGLTNGLRGRTNGLTNGLRGRTNGLTNGLRGRTNGLTNGLGRTNGLTNGLRGRTNGLTNGLRGRTNGLTNGLRGRTNGLTNGLGRTNGLRPMDPYSRFQRRFNRSPIARFALPVALVLLILIPVFFLWTVPTPTLPIQIDGQFGDWAGVTKVNAVPPPSAPNPDIQITRVAVHDNIDYLAFYLQVQGNATAGGPLPTRIMNVFYAFLDTDRSRTTGYRIQGIGADRMVRVGTWGGQVLSASLLEFGPGRGQQDWNGWVSAGTVDAAAAGSQIEFQVPWLDLPTAHAPVAVAFAARGWDGQSDAADVIVTNADPFLIVSQATAAPLVIASPTSAVSRFSFRAVDGDMRLTGLNVTLFGTFGASAVLAVSLVDEAGTLLAEGAPAKSVRFDLSSFTISRDQVRTLAIRLTIGTADGSTIGALLLNVDDVRVALGGVSFQSQATKPDSLGYLGSVPSGPRIDGAFGEWTNITLSPTGNVQPVWDRDADISGYSFMGASDGIYFMAETVGTALNGTMIPALNPAYAPSPGNGTGNGSTPPPYVPPPVNGTDLLRIFVDADGSASTGYAMGSVGADYLVEVTGKEGVITSSLTMRFAGTSQLEWRWTPVGTAPAAKDSSHIEVALPGVTATNLTRAIFEITGWNGAHDGTNPARPMSLGALPGVMYAPGAITGIDPTGIIDTSSSIAATGGPVQRNLLYDGANFWAFYYDGTTIQYEASGTGLSWTGTKNPAFTTTNVPTVSAWFNLSGSTKNVYVVGDTGLNTKTVDVRQGTIAGTTITWAASDSSVTVSDTNPGTGNTKDPVIIRDSQGYLWLGANDTNTNRLNNFVVARSNLTGNVSAFKPKQYMGITNYSTKFVQGVLVPLPSGGQVYAIWYANGTISGRLYTGTAWSGTVDTIATAPSNNMTAGPSAIADASGNIGLVYVDSAGSVQFKQRQGSTWQSATSLDSSSGNWYPTITWDNATGNLYAFWISSTGQIKAQVHSGTSWASASLEVNTNGKVGLTSVYSVGPTSNVSWAWTQKYCQAGSTTCYDVKSSLYNSTLNSRTIDTTTDTSALSFNNQRKVFYDGSYVWSFYFDGSNTVYTYSNSSVSTWESPVARAFSTSGVGNPSVWFYGSGGSKIVYVVGDLAAPPSSKTYTVNVRRGTISGTTITWGTEVATSVSGSLFHAKVPFITRDENGYLWIVTNVQHTGNSPNLNICAIRSTNPDNTSSWTTCGATAGGLLSADIANNFIFPTILPLSGGDMFAVWYADGSVAGRKYSASNATWWSSMESIASTTAGVTTKIPSAVVDGAYNVDVVYVSSTGAIQFRQRTSTWGTVSSLDSSTGSTSPTITLELGSNDLDVFYVSSTNQIKGQYYHNAGWSAITGYIDASTTNKTYLTSIYSVNTRGLVMWMWGAGVTSPLEIRISRIAIPEFDDVAPPIAGTVAMMLFFILRRRARRQQGHVR